MGRDINSKLMISSVVDAVNVLSGDNDDVKKVLMFENIWRQYARVKNND